MGVPLPYLLITVQAIELQNIGVSGMRNLFPNTLSANSRYSLHNRDNLTESIEMQLSRKQKTFSEFFSAFLKASLNFNIFKEKKMTLIADIFPKLRTTKSLVRSILKKPVPRDPSERKMANATKHC